ncbi:uncharacterized protein N7459_005715 [Penicillium hispanicum]|uniref:uncharacterized protein n=1 Tax=Penicillium hispanicum TaxID=1080232 RepID=UPI0025411D71|nr:uncharacterized protein N7459_005715 [Penicillium hispanicum]KAJ5579730.1 hypothetical protein N7459_005715 [Penicillium hispanicum]
MKGFVGGIPLALLVAALQAQAMEYGAQGNSVNNHGFHQRRQLGGTALGGPSGKDDDGSFTSPYSADVKAHTNVNGFSQDDHSIKVKDKDVYPPPPLPYGPALGPGAGPFPEHAKRSFPYGGTALGGPSGNDEGQSFDMPITGNFHTDVNEYNKDDHSTKVKSEDIHPPPIVHPPPVHPPPVKPAGPPPAEKGPSEPIFRNAAGNAPSDHFHVPATAFGKRFGPEAGGTALGGPGSGSKPEGPGPVVAGGTVLGGPSGPDEGTSFNAPVTGTFATDVNEHSKDDHSVDVKHTDVFPPPPPHPPFGPPFKRHWPPTEGGTALGGPSGQDDGISFNAPVTGNFHTNVDEASKDDHSIAVKNKDVFPPPPPPFGPPFKRHWGPTEGGTALGGPSGDDGGQSFSAPITVDTHTGLNEDYEDNHSRAPGGGTALGGPSGEDDGETVNDPTNVDVGSKVNEDHVDNHAIKSDSTDVHLPPFDVPHMPWMEYPPPAHLAGPHPPAGPPAGPPGESTEAPTEHQAPPREDHEEVPQCAAQVHEVVRTVTKTQYKDVQPTETVFKEIPASHVAEASAVPEVSPAQPKLYPSAAHASQSPSSPGYQYGSEPSSSPSYDFGASPSDTPSYDFGSYPSSQPSYQYGASPSGSPSYSFGSFPSSSPSYEYGASPSGTPSYDFGASPSGTPSYSFGSFPSSYPSYEYGASPSGTPSYNFGSSASSYPSYQYNASPSQTPSYDFGSYPSSQPSYQYGASPSGTPSYDFGASPSGTPSYSFGSFPSSSPSYEYGASPSGTPSYDFGASPSGTPSYSFGSLPSSYPSYEYGASPSGTPSYNFGSFPSSSPSYEYGASPSEAPSYDFGSFPSSGLDPSYNYGSAPSSYPSFDYGASPSSEPYSASGASYARIPVHVPMATPSSSRYMASMATPASRASILPSGASSLNSASASAMPSAHGTMFTGASTRVSGGLVSAAAAMLGVLAFVL